MNEEEERLMVVGSTVRVEYHMRQYPAVHIVLVAGDTLASHYWLNILAMSGDIRLRYYITEDDFLSMQTHLHVHPDVVPSFLVVVDGYIVDWFAAPLPGPGGIQDPSTLLSTVTGRMAAYD